MFRKQEEVITSGSCSRGSAQARQLQGISLNDYIDQCVNIAGPDEEVHLAAPGYDHIKICLTVSLFLT